MRYPPFSDIISIGISGTNEKEVIEVSHKFYDILKEDIGNTELFSPIPAPISKIKNNYRWRILIKTKFDDDIIYIINNALDEFEKMKYDSVRVIIDVNPNNMT